MKVKRVACVFVFCFAAVLTISATGTGEEEETFSLEVQTWRHPPMEEIISNDVIPSFEAKHPNVNVVYDRPGTSAELNDRFIIASQGEAAPDVVALPRSYLANHVYLGNVDPIDLQVFGVDTQEEYAKLWSGGHGIMMYEGMYYGTVLEASSYCMVINTEHFREIGLDPEKDYPLTWIEGERSVASIGKKLTKIEGDRIVQEGYGLATEATPSIIVYYGMLGNLGKELLTPDGKSTNLASPESVRVLQTYRDFVYKYRITRPGGVGVTASKRGEFQSGTASMINNIWSWYKGVMEGYPDVYRDGDGIKFIENPSYTDGVPYSSKYGSLYLVSSQSKHKKEAWEFQKELMDHADLFIATGLLVPVRGYETSAAAQAIPDFDVFARILEYPGTEQIRTPDVATSWGNALAKVVLEEDTDIVEVLRTANEEIEEYLAGLPYRP